MLLTRVMPWDMSARVTGEDVVGAVGVISAAAVFVSGSISSSDGN